MIPHLIVEVNSTEIYWTKYKHNTLHTQQQKHNIRWGSGSVNIGCRNNSLAIVWSEIVKHDFVQLQKPLLWGPCGTPIWETLSHQTEHLTVNLSAEYSFHIKRSWKYGVLCCVVFFIFSGLVQRQKLHMCHLGSAVFATQKLAIIPKSWLDAIPQIHCLAIPNSPTVVSRHIVPIAHVYCQGLFTFIPLVSYMPVCWSQICTYIQ